MRETPDETARYLRNAGWELILDQWQCPVTGMFYTWDKARLIQHDRDKDGDV